MLVMLQLMQENITQILCGKLNVNVLRDHDLGADQPV